MSLLSARNLSRSYDRAPLLGRGRPHRVLDGVSLDIAPGETVALLGRSGCGKTTLARMLVGLDRPDAGEVLFEGQSLARLPKARWQDLRRTVQMVFQDPVGAVDPRATVGDVLAEPLRNLCGLSPAEIRLRIAELLSAVELGPEAVGRYPHQMSGGQLQRVCIARALAPQPRLVILDEAVSNLDVHLQIRMLELFAELRRARGVSYLFVTHDLRLVERFCSRVLVMDTGRIAEDAPAALALRSPAGRALQEAVLPAWPLAGRLPPVGDLCDPSALADRRQIAR
ncbi:nickel ABC transporter ATP-binding protein NikE [Chelatococcus reniformis]|uniref:Nickel import ATP-binding protein NikE n=1 Tax=Chelatococcus reniformis TaxID=1494448 RepID=A0A916UUP7_9HYPH|nr:nickel ABC transporter ATP-binding protein NikE [Chelatococcus reniformis]GGC87925.1 nickel import ATP-binding protein NikE [Chelatococcus reniformis]